MDPFQAPDTDSTFEGLQGESLQSKDKRDLSWESFITLYKCLLPIPACCQWHHSNQEQSTAYISKYSEH